MKLLGAVLKFKLDRDDSLMTLVRKHGYSKPTKENPSSTKVHDLGTIELRRPDQETCMVGIFPASDCDKELNALLAVALDDLQVCGLYTSPPF